MTRLLLPLAIIFLTGCINVGPQGITRKEAYNTFREAMGSATLELKGQCISGTSEFTASGNFLVPSFNQGVASIPPGYYTDADMAGDFIWFCLLVIALTVGLTRLASTCPGLMLISKKMVSFLVSVISGLIIYAGFRLLTHHDWWMIGLWTIISWVLSKIIWDEVFTGQWLGFFTNKDPKVKFAKYLNQTRLP